LKTKSDFSRPDPILLTEDLSIMTTYEIITIFVSLVAVVLSIISLVRTRKVQKEQIELQKITAELSRKQIQIIEREQAEQNKAKISVELVRFGNDYRFLISNVGYAKASNIHFDLDQDCQDNPLVQGDYETKIPIPSLNPGSSIELLAAISMGSAGRYHVLVRWDNPDGTQEEDRIFVAI